MPKSFVLASASPARRRLLQLAGIEPFAFPSAFDEDSVVATNPAELVEKLAVSKLQASLDKLWQQKGSAPGGFFSPSPGLILGCDSVLSINGEIYGKPDSAQDAIDRWKTMRGQVGELFTGHALSDGFTQDGKLSPQKIIVRHRVTRVFFAQVSDREIVDYVATGEPMNCAGCFAIEGRGSVFIDRIEGCHTNVIGLCMPLLREMMGEVGYSVTEFWRK
ncbi:MAG: Maf family protein [Cyanobacteria bacterium]|nr:Maf family protein [Cyanobacteriota bacterium]